MTPSSPAPATPPADDDQAASPAVWPLAVAIGALLLVPVSTVVAAYGWPAWSPLLLAAVTLAPPAVALAALVGAWRGLARRPAIARRDVGLAAVAVASVALVLSVGLVVMAAGLAVPSQTGGRPPEAQPAPLEGQS